MKGRPDDDGFLASHRYEMSETDRAALVARMEVKVAHLPVLRKAIMNKALRSVLRGKLLIHMATLVLLVLYIISINVDGHIGMVNRGVLNMLLGFKVMVESGAGHYRQLSLSRITSHGEFEKWTRDAVLQNILVDSTPGPVDNETKLESYRIIREKAYLLWGVRLRQLRVDQLQQLGHCRISNQLTEPIYVTNAKYDVWGSKVSTGWLSPYCYPQFDITMLNKTHFSASIDRAQAASLNLSYFEPRSGRDGSLRGYFSDYPASGWVYDMTLSDARNPDTLFANFDKITKVFFDHQTEAILIEFTLYFPSVNAYSSVQVLFEEQITGYVKVTPHISTAVFNTINQPSIPALLFPSGLGLTVVFILYILRWYRGLRCNRYYFSVTRWDILDVCIIILWVFALIHFWAEVVAGITLVAVKSLLQTSQVETIAWATHFMNTANLQAGILTWLCFVRTLQFCKLSGELDLAWRAIKGVVYALSKVFFYLVAPGIVGVIAAVFIMFGSQEVELATLDKTTVAIIRMLLRNDAFSTFYEDITHSVIDKDLILFIYLAVVLLFIFVFHSILQSVVFAMWMRLKREDRSPQPPHFTNYLSKLIMLPVRILTCKVSPRDFLSRFRRLFRKKDHASWQKILRAIDRIKTKRKVIYFNVLKDSIVKVLQNKSSDDSSGCSCRYPWRTGNTHSREIDVDQNEKEATEKWAAIQAAVAFLEVEFIGAVWSEDELLTYSKNDEAFQKSVDSYLASMLRNGRRIQISKFIEGMSREQALKLTEEIMEEENPYSQRGFIRKELRLMTSKLNFLRNEVTRDLDTLANQLNEIAFTHETGAEIVQQIVDRFEIIDDHKGHDTSVAVQHGRSVEQSRNQIFQVYNPNSFGSKKEPKPLEYDAVW